MHAPALRPRVAMRLLAPLMALSYDEKLNMVKMGLAVPGFAAEGREASSSISRQLQETGVFELGASRPAAASAAPPKRCTRDDPCDLDGDVVQSLILTPGPIILLAGFAYALGTQAFAAEDDEAWLEKLERQAERSREKRLARQRDLASRLAPLQELLGWPLVSADGLPTSDAYTFVAAAVVTQLLLALALRNALFPG